ncbi:MAG: formylmethanofuran dehydrogenase subunit E family protein [Eubacteriaceae bacterium]|nr:formylmethanofuran dehydrogenase subunit E family protein [Eubacteriaceae bacterium]
MDEKLLERAEEFHGHMCGGLTIGLRTGLLAQKLFSEISFRNAEIIVTSKTSACPKDGLMVVLGVRPDNRTLEINPDLDCDYKFYDIIDEKTVKVFMKELPEGVTREQSAKFYREAEDEAIFRWEIIEE